MLWGDAGIQNHHISGRISCFLKLFGLRGIYQQKDHVQNVIFVESDQMHPTLLIHRQELMLNFCHMGALQNSNWGRLIIWASTQYIESEKGRQRVLNTAQMGLFIDVPY